MGKLPAHLFPPCNPGIRLKVHVLHNRGGVVGAAEGAALSQPFDELRETLRDLSPQIALQTLDEAQSTLQKLRFEVLEGELQSAIASVQPSPAVASGLATSQRLLARLEEHEGTRLLSAAEMARFAQKSRNWPADKVRAGQLIRVKHAGQVRYPAFQIDLRTREIWPWVPQMVQILDELGLDGRSFAVWAAVKSSRFDGDPPAVHAGDEDFLFKAAAALADE